MRRVLFVAVAAFVFAPLSALAVPYGWCVDDRQLETDFSCSEFVGCDNTTPFVSIEDALTAAAATPNGTSHHICVRSGAPHTESFVVDDSAGALAGDVRIEFLMQQSTNYCPGPSAAPPIRVLGGPQGTAVEFFTFWSDFAGCAGMAGPLLDIVGADVTLANAQLSNYPGDLAALSAGSGGQATLRIDLARIQRFEGSLTTGTGELRIDGSEISGLRSPRPITGAPGVSFSISDSAVFGNLVEGGGPLLRFVADSTSRGVLYGANVVMDGGPLLHMVLETDGAAATVWGGEFSRNRLLGSGSADAAPSLALNPAGLPVDYCLPPGSQGDSYAGRATPTASGAPSQAPLVLVEVAAGAIGTRATLAKVFVVENETAAGGSLIAVDGRGEAHQLALLHNTFSALSGPLLEGGGTDSRFVTGRNLFTSDPILALDGTWTKGELILDQGPTSPWADRADIDEVLWVPLPGQTPQFRTAAQILALDSCARVQAVCPEVDDCASWGAFDCAVDRARGYVPTASQSEALENPWVWETDGLPDGGPGSVPGATGWTCSTAAAPWDLLGPGGDGDGWSSLTDCNNEDGDTLPSIPDLSGVGSDDCIEIADDCYRCPPGSNLVDDDDTGTIDDDDDSFDAENSVPVGCTSRGCGAAIDCGSGQTVAWLFVLPLGMWRRRRVRSPSLA